MFIPKSFQSIKKRNLFFLFLFNFVFFSLQAFAQETSYNFVWGSHASDITQIVCSNYGDDAIAAKVMFYDTNGLKFYLRKIIGNEKVVAFSTKDFDVSYFKKTSSNGIVEIKFDEDDNINVNCVASMKSGTRVLLQRSEDFKTKSSFISINKDVIGTGNGNTLFIANFLDKNASFRILVYNKDGSLSKIGTLTIQGKKIGTFNIGSGYYKTIHIEPQGDAKYIAYTSYGSKFYKSKEGFEKAGLLPAKGKLLLTNTYFTPAMYTYKVFEGDKIKYQGYQFIPPYAQEAVELESYTKDLKNPAIKINSIEAYTPVGCPQNAKVCPKKGANGKDLYLLGEIVDSNKNEYEAKDSDFYKGNVFEIPFVKVNNQNEAFLNIYQESENETEIKLVSRLSNKDNLYTVKGKEELKIKISDVTTLLKDSLQIISPNKIRVIFEDKNNTLEYAPVFVEDEEEIKGQLDSNNNSENNEGCAKKLKSIPNNYNNPPVDYPDTQTNYNNIDDAKNDVSCNILNITPTPTYTPVVCPSDKVYVDAENSACCQPKRTIEGRTEKDEYWRVCCDQTSLQTKCEGYCRDDNGNMSWLSFFDPSEGLVCLKEAKFRVICMGSKKQGGDCPILSVQGLLCEIVDENGNVIKGTKKEDPILDRVVYTMHYDELMEYYNAKIIKYAKFTYRTIDKGNHYDIPLNDMLKTHLDCIKKYRERLRNPQLNKEKADDVYFECMNENLEPSYNIILMTNGYKDQCKYLFTSENTIVFDEDLCTKVVQVNKISKSEFLEKYEKLAKGFPGSILYSSEEKDTYIYMSQEIYHYGKEGEPMKFNDGLKSMRIF